MCDDLKQLSLDEEDDDLNKSNGNNNQQEEEEEEEVGGEGEEEYLNKSDTVNFKSKPIPHQSNLPPLNNKNERSHYRESMVASKQNIGSYVVGEMIGKGAFASVFKGLNTLTGDFVAIKRFEKSKISKEQHSSVSVEFDILQRLNHENIVRILGREENENYIYIFLEYMENGSLSSIVNNFGTFPESLVCTYTENVLKGLVYLHQEGVIHRDIKAANILINKAGEAKLSDFGTAGEIIKESDRRYSVVGTPYWMAPEVIEMSGHCQASDIWSLGCTIIELITSYPPYFDLNPLGAMYRICQDDKPTFPDDISKDLNSFLSLCFVKSIEERASAKDLLSHSWITKNRNNIINHQRNTSKIGLNYPQIIINNNNGGGGGGGVSGSSSNNSLSNSGGCDSDSDNNNTASNASSRSSSFIDESSTSNGGSKNHTIIIPNKPIGGATSSTTTSQSPTIEQIEFNKLQMELQLLKLRVSELEKDLQKETEAHQDSDRKYREILLSSMHYIYIIDSTMNTLTNNNQSMKPQISNEVNHLRSIMRDQIETEYFQTFPDDNMVPRFIQRRFTQVDQSLLNIPKKALEAQKRREKLKEQEKQKEEKIKLEQQEKLKKKKEKDKKQDKKLLEKQQSAINLTTTTTSSNEQQSAFHSSPITPLSPTKENSSTTSRPFLSLKGRSSSKIFSE